MEVLQFTRAKFGSLESKKERLSLTSPNFVQNTYYEFFRHRTVQRSA